MQTEGVKSVCHWHTALSMRAPCLALKGRLRGKKACSLMPLSRGLHPDLVWRGLGADPVRPGGMLLGISA